ncbi:MAG TPA: Zn-binding domain-containing protein, partial [Anaerolineae bacterium]
LEAAVLAGYPGTIASAWQQMGRAGRRQGKSLAVLVASPEPVDQYLVTHPEYLFERSPEHALVNPDNPVILANHLSCAAAELPFVAADGFGRAPGLPAALDFLAEAGELYYANGRYLWAGEGYPAGDLSLRAGQPDRLLVQMPGADGRPQVIGEMDRAGAAHLLYPGAIYMHLGETYLVERLDWEAGAAAVRPVEVDFYTRPSIGEDVEVLAEHAACGFPPGPLSAGDASVPAAAEGGGNGYVLPAASNAAPGTADAAGRGGDLARAHFGWGDVRVIGRMNGYRTLRRYTNELLSFTPLEMPEEVLETAACWIALGPDFVEALRAEGAWLSSPNDYGPSWPAQRAAARARDGFRCQVCGAAEGNEALPANRREHDVHHKIPLRAFVAHAELRPGLPPELAWQAANRLENLVTLCPACHHRAEAHVRLHSGLGGLAALLSGVAPLFLMCDPRDLGVITEAQAPATGLATITIYEKVPAGVGYAAELYKLMPELLAAAAELLARCPCEQGCPSCVGPVLDHEYALDAKALTRTLLARLLAG